MKNPNGHAEPPAIDARSAYAQSQCRIRELEIERAAVEARLGDTMARAALGERVDVDKMRAEVDRVEAEIKDETRLSAGLRPHSLLTEHSHLVEVCQQYNSAADDALAKLRIVAEEQIEAFNRLAKVQQRLKAAEAAELGLRQQLH